MQSLQNVHVLRQLATEREVQLRRASLQVGRGHRRRPVRRWLGRQLVRFGAWVAAEPTMRPARAR